ncbi:hypothetical protein RFI_06632 [Reticulomyxa filosa]|uniref:Uncharacterized protein n=1 Tax=Reticulomyxa filosa TaxID=46433 RepID=X6NYY6_RETFI|nr:hypothetical protein RFI_06632 [Reticulomyxa filosa]|eukprot:ETO30487.1 hypothetical protein RFI_06632 [Reticulomyxa filosa]
MAESVSIVGDDANCNETNFSALKEHVGVLIRTTREQTAIIQQLMCSNKTLKGQLNCARMQVLYGKVFTQYYREQTAKNEEVIQSLKRNEAWHKSFLDGSFYKNTQSLREETARVQQQLQEWRQKLERLFETELNKLSETVQVLRKGKELPNKDDATWTLELELMQINNELNTRILLICLFFWNIPKLDVLYD